jgi:hypothetical protein
MGCRPVLVGRLGKADAGELAAAFEAVADPARLRLLIFIARQAAEALGRAWLLAAAGRQS